VRQAKNVADEIRFWADYMTPGRGGYIYDDEGGRGGLHPSALFVVAGDQNSDPLDGDSLRDAAGDPIAIQPLLNSPRVNAHTTPESAGAAGGFPTSDHRLVWADLDLPGVR
jgi:hypothetical protein